MSIKKVKEIECKSEIYLWIDIWSNMWLSLYINDDMPFVENRKIVSTTIKWVNTQNIISNINDFLNKNGSKWWFDDFNVNEYWINLITCTSHKKFYNVILSHWKLFWILEYVFWDIIYLNEKRMNKEVFWNGNIKKEEVSERMESYFKQNKIEHIIDWKETLDWSDSMKFIFWFLWVKI